MWLRCVTVWRSWMLVVVGSLVACEPIDDYVEPAPTGELIFEVRPGYCSDWTCATQRLYRDGDRVEVRYYESPDGPFDHQVFGDLTPTATSDSTQIFADLVASEIEPLPGCDGHYEGSFTIFYAAPIDREIDYRTPCVTAGVAELATLYFRATDAAYVCESNHTITIESECREWPYVWLSMAHGSVPAD